jgi:hypothetical protein
MRFQSSKPSGSFGQVVIGHISDSLQLTAEDHRFAVEFDDPLADHASLLGGFFDASFGLSDGAVVI